MDMRSDIGFEVNIDERRSKSKATIEGIEGSPMAGNLRREQELQRVKDFNMREFLHLAHRVVDEGDDAVMAALEELKCRWEAKIGRAPAPTALDAVPAHQLAKGLRRACHRLLSAGNPTEKRPDEQRDVSANSLQQKTADVLQNPTPTAEKTQQDQSVELLDSITEKYDEFGREETTKIGDFLVNSSLEFAVPKQQFTIVLSRESGWISGPCMENQNTNKRAMGGDQHNTGIFIGTVPLRSSNTPESSVDKFADAFNNSSRRTLKFIESWMQNGEVVIRPSLNMVRDGSRPWKHMAVGYFLGKKPYFHHLNKFVQSIWPTVKDVIATSNRFYFFQFHTLAVMEEVIEGGPWLFQGQPIVLQRWEPGMALRKHKHTQIPVWIRLRHLPVEFGTSDGLSAVASGMGKPLYPDAITRACTRLNFARVCLMFDVSSKLPKHVVLLMPTEDGAEVPCKVDVEYEWLPLKSRSYMSLGYDAITCPTTNKPAQNFQIFIQRSQKKKAIEKEVEDVEPPRSRGDASNYRGDIRRTLWRDLHDLSEEIAEEAWFVMGVFNAVLDMSEVCSASRDIRQAMKEFQSCVTEMGLITLPMKGETFTWHNCSGDGRSFWKRLDRVLANDVVLHMWPNAYYRCLAPATSDHSSLLLQGGSRLNYPIFSSMRQKKGDLSINVQHAKKFLTTAQELLAHDIHDETFLLLEHCCRIVLMKAVKLEQSMLRRRAKMQRLKEVDQCSRIFFRKVATRRATKRIYQIKGPDDNMINE
ncbi:UNVERIFIED_CONTAM: hypothetical protein Sindi_0717000 [Sesamum indicum]